MGKASQDVQDHILRKTLQKLNHCSAGMYWLWEHKRKQNFTDWVMAQWLVLRSVAIIVADVIILHQMAANPGWIVCIQNGLGAV